MEFLLSPPSWVWIVGPALAIGVWVYGNNRTDAKIRWAGFGLLLGGLLWGVVSFMIDTPLEASVKRTRDIVRLASEEKWDEFQGKFDAQTTIGAGPLALRGAEPIRKIVESNWNRYQFRSVTILSLVAVQSGSLISVEISVLSDMQFPQRSSWRFDYEKRSDGVLLARIEPLSVDGANIEQIRARLGGSL